VVKAIVTMHGGSVFARCEGGEVLIGFLLPRPGAGVTDDEPQQAAALPSPAKAAVDA
jgi:two-component system heavy metal sensor histidine kinase CusS